MAQGSSIEWTDATWNPVRGCSRVSEGCRNCYAEKFAARFGRPKKPDAPAKSPAGPYVGFVQLTSAGPRWTGKVELIEKHLTDPLKWKKPQKIFVNSMSDLFHEALPARDMDAVFAVMSQSPQHTFQILTKRPRIMREYMIAERTPDGIDEAADRFGRCHANVYGRWPLPNVWLGVSVEDRKHKDRIDVLRETPAALRFLSIEPLLEDIGELDLRGIDWVIVGGESGPGARPMHPDWPRKVRDQCAAAGVPFLFKQWGEYAPLSRTDGFHELPFGDYNVDSKFGFIRSGKHKSGRLLDGRECNEFPREVACPI